MLSEAKDTSELMVDLGYAALFFADEAWRTRSHELEERLNELVHEMRGSACSPPARRAMPSRCRACSMSSRAIERMGNAAVDIAPHRDPPPRHPARRSSPTSPRAEEVSHRVRVRAGFGARRPPLAEVELPIEVGMRDRRHPARPGLDHRSRRRRAAAAPTTCSSSAAQRDGIAELRELAGAPAWAAAGGRPRTRRSATSTARSTCSSR